MKTNKTDEIRIKERIRAIEILDKNLRTNSNYEDYQVTIIREIIKGILGKYTNIKLTKRREMAIKNWFGWRI
jgi:hypothetical protein